MFSSSKPISGNLWIDLSGHSRHATLSGTIQRGQDAASRYYLFAGVDSSISFMVPPISGRYTLFHRARYNGINRQRVFTHVTLACADWFSGFQGGKAGVALHGNLITPDIDVHGTNWVQSTDQYDLFRSNGVQRSNATGTVGTMCELGINAQMFGEKSDWAVSDVIMYNRDLSLTEILEVENYLNVTQSGIPLGGSANILGTSGSSSSNSYIFFPVITLTDFTITFCIKTTDTYGSSGGTQWYQGKGLVDSEISSGGVTDFGITLLAGKIAFGVGNPDTTIISTRTINDGMWHYIAVMREGSRMTIYLDGAFDVSISNGPIGARNSVNQLAIGVLRTLVGGSLNGFIDEVRVYNQASPAYVSDALRRSTTNLPAALVNFYPLNENALDYSGNSKHGTVTNVKWVVEGK